MTVTPIFDGLAASFAAAPAPSVEGRAVVGPARREPRRADRPSPRPRPVAVVGSAAFGRGCLEAAPEEDGPVDDEVTRLLEGARREAIALGGRWVGTQHLALAAVRGGGDVGRVFGMRGAGPAVLLAAITDADDAADDLAGGDPLRPALSAVARTVVHRVAHRAAREDRAVTAADLAIAVARSGRVADLLARLGVDLDDLVDALTVGGETARAPRPALDAATVPLRRVPVPVGVVAPVTVMLPTAAPAGPGDRAADVPA